MSFGVGQVPICFFLNPVWFPLSPFQEISAQGSLHQVSGTANAGHAAQSLVLLQVLLPNRIIAVAAGCSLSFPE